MTAFRTPIATINELNMMLAEPNSDIKHFVLVDENTQKYALPRLFEQCPILHDAGIINIASGEQHKNLETFSWIIEQLTENQADRKSLLINLGGGVISDMGGFAAACYKRGIDFVNIPTTLLAMIDAAHGGKTGVDFKSFKNQIGVFAPAKMVVIDVEFLNTLPKSEILSGFAEMIKIALITSVDFWNQIQHVDLNNLETLKPLIIEAIEKKNTIVEKDLTEQNIRKNMRSADNPSHGYNLS